MVERGRNISYIKLVIIQGKAYIKKYEDSFQTRDVFTVWGILQLLRLYPGKIPDLELLFETGDRAVVDKQHFRESPPPVFHYCGQKNAYDIVFPDWSFWGWAELTIKPWEALLQKINEGKKKIKWKDRLPYAFWKGNTCVSLTRYDLLRCNTSDQYAHIYPLAEAIGKPGRNFIKENLKMKFVYDYMFHVLSEYARLLRFEPIILEGAVEICSENLVCPKNDL
ncbi:hypothetical protein VNO78_15333 [Psophocarpus tetragonolobus]|uniref:Glycosyl transferase CAP10 domain-containing protein n=1 Tax=Psophocarpus tetragonolobus TaxID=3891 RepID=A0AAN9SDY6_PSOTE